MFIGDLFVGYNDGKKEAAYRENFENYYFNYGGMYDKVLGKDKFLILGRKGTGKTLLAEYMKKQALLKGGWLCEICSCRNFRFQELFALKTRDIKPNEYSAIWEWLLLIKLGELVIRDVNAKYESVTAISNFFKNYFFGTKLDMNKVVEVTKKKSISANLFGKFFGAKGEAELNSKENQCNYLDYLLEFKEKIFSALSTSVARYDLVLDELDDQFRNEELYKSNIISLIKTIDKLNGEFIEYGLDVKILAILRSDIFYILNDSDLNKIEQDNAIKINWGSASDLNSPIVNMILVKIKQSMIVKDGEVLELEEIRKRLFSEKIKVGDKKYDMLSFMLSRTYLRPRDLITFLRCIIDINPQEEMFTSKNLKNAEKEYSEYLIKEIKNEMHGHIDVTGEADPATQAALLQMETEFVSQCAAKLVLYAVEYDAQAGKVYLHLKNTGSATITGFELNYYQCNSGKTSIGDFFGNKNTKSYEYWNSTEWSNQDLAPGDTIVVTKLFYDGCEVEFSDGSVDYMEFYSNVKYIRFVLSKFTTENGQRVDGAGANIYAEIR